MSVSSEASAEVSQKQKKASKKKEGQQTGKKKKKGSFWKALLWILSILIILLACAAVIDHYLFNSKGRNWVAQYLPIPPAQTATGEATPTFPTIPTDYDRDAARDNITDFTFSTEGLEFSEVELDEERDQILFAMKSHISSHLKALNQSKNEETFLYHVSDYIDNRLTDLIESEDFSATQLMTQGDYVHEAALPMLKNTKMKKTRAIIMSELMSDEVLERLLSEIVPADELTPDPNAIEERPEVKKETPKAPKAQKPQPTRSHVATSSKQGFDIVAGFYVNKASADKMCSQLKSKGCDAYIINRNGLYYVSMGSAASRTEADAKFNHIKEWYKGDISIKQW